MNKLLDWKRVYVQLAFLITVILFNMCLNIPVIVINAFKDASVAISELPVEWQFAIGSGRWILAIAIFVTAYLFIRMSNKKEVLKQNIPNVIVWHSYLGYWVCRYILGYQKVSLTRVPIPVQFELVWKGLFKEYEYMDGVTEKKDADNVSVETLQAEPYTSTVNLILADTYPLDNWKTKVPAPTTSFSTIIINRYGDRGVRCYSKDYVLRIATTIHELPATVTDINIFATINTAHVYHIVNEVFKTGGRDNLKRIKVYQQTSGTWVFEGKKYKEIKIGE